MSIASWGQLTDELVNHPEMSGLTEEQLKAVIDVLALTIHADCRVSPIEVAGFNHLFFDLPWLEDRHAFVRAHVPVAAERGAVAGDVEKGRAVAAAAAASLQAASLRERVFLMASSLAAVDMKADPNENIALQWVAEAFGIAADRRAELIARVRP